MRAQHLRRVIRLKFQIIVRIDNARDHFFHVVRQTVIGRQQIVQSFGGFRGSRSLQHCRGLVLINGKLADLFPDQRQAREIVLGRIMRHAADLGMERRAAERFGIHHLPHRALHQVRTAQSHETGLLDHDDHVGERRQIRAARDAHAHHRGDLRNFQPPPHQRVVVENPRRAVLPGKDAVLIGQIHARRIHQVDDRQPVAHRDFLGSQNLVDRLGPPRAGLHRGVVGDDHARPLFDVCQARDHARRGSLAVVAVVGDQQADFEKQRARIDQMRDALARRQLALSVLFFDLLRAAAELELLFEFLDTAHEPAHAVGRSVGHHSMVISCACARMIKPSGDTLSRLGR